MLRGESKSSNLERRRGRVAGSNVSLPTAQGRRLRGVYRSAQQEKLHFVVHDFEPGYDTYTEKPGYSWDADMAFADVNPADYAALVIPGGRAPEYIRNNSDCEKIIRHFFEHQKPIAQLCQCRLGTCGMWGPEGQAHCRLPGLRTGYQGGRC